MTKQLKKLELFFNKYKFVITLILFIEIFTFIIITLISGYVPPNGGVSGKWRISQIIDLKSYIFNISQTWDSSHYLNIAQNWYSPSQPSEYAFFPLLPIIIKTCSFIFPFLSIYIVSIIVSFILFQILGVLLKKIFIELNFEKKSDNFTLFTIIFPFSIFYLFVYTESLFISLTIICALLLKKLYDTKSKSKLVIYFALIASSFALSVTRNLGFLFGFSIFLTHLIVIFLSIPDKSKQEYFKSTFKSLFISFSFFVSGLIGLISVLSIGYFTTGDFLKSYNAQQYWGRKTEWNIFKTIYESFSSVFTPDKIYSGCNNYLDCVYGFTYPLFGLLISLLLVFALFKIYKKYIISKSTWNLSNLYLLSLIIFSILLSLLSLTKGLGGYNRYIISTPMYYLGLPIVISKVFTQKYQQLVITFCAMLFTVFVCLFGLHHWVG